MKFKVWDSEEKKFLEGQELQRFWVNPDGELVRDFKIRYVAEPRYTKARFTTDFDKDGVEIFEGSIIYYESEAHTGHVWFNGNCFMTNATGWGDEVFADGEDFKVIGNKYENPELLKQ